ncbi:MAG TPA: LuxR C-terminal-related transcriptional regulator [Chthoniobacterales bacterium]|nr:LuxR C-terminal-related transcriptional regulator [Chthoniobacterales bacterium]
MEKPLLKLHSALDAAALWRAVQSVLDAALPGSFIGLTLQHNPIQPMITKWTRSIPDGLFDLTPLRNYLDSHPRSRFVRASDVFPDRARLIRSDFYRQYMAPQQCAHAIGLFFWRGHRLVSVIVIMRTAEQGEFTSTQMKLLRSLYPQFQTALRRLGSLEREHSARAALEQFIQRLPLPTILLRWNLKLIYQNQAAREFCALWQMGPHRAQLLKANVPVPSAILDGCRELEKRWRQDRQSLPLSARSISSWKTVVRHPKLRHLRANLRLRQSSSLAIARPHFLIECEELSQTPRNRGGAGATRLPHLARLTRREQQVTRLVCEGRSNQEIADEARLSLTMVKKHLHSIFQKLEISSRARLIALMR